MSLSREQFLTQSKTTREAWETHWASLRLPSLSDHARLAGQIVALESKIEGLEDKLDTALAHLEALSTRARATTTAAN
jgi:hypothetical protein